MLLKTGFGYIVSNGKKTHKFDLHPGEHFFDPTCSIVEVDSREELEKIVLDMPDLTDKQKAILAKQKARHSAIDKLKTVAGLTSEEVEALKG